MWKPSFGGPNKKKVKVRDEQQSLKSEKDVYRSAKEIYKKKIKKVTTATS